MSVEAGWVTEEDWKNPVKEGTMRKRGSKGHFSKKWSIRYFRLKGGSLFWFKNKTDDLCGGHIPLFGAEIETNTEKTNKYAYCFKLYCKKLDKSYYLIAEDYDEMDKWIEAIKQQTRTDALSKGGSKQPGLLVESSDDEEDDGPYVPKKGR